MALLSRFALLSAIPVLLSSSASSQSLPKAPKTEVITVTPKPGFFTEPSIGVNPANPLQVVAAFQDNAHIAYSVDGIGDMSVVLKSGDNLQRVGRIHANRRFSEKPRFGRHGYDFCFGCFWERLGRSTATQQNGDRTEQRESRQ